MEAANDVGHVFVVKVRYFTIFYRFDDIKLSNFLSDSKYTYSEMTYVTKSAYAGDTGCCGTLIIAMEHRLNGILACPEQVRTGRLYREKGKTYD